MMSTSLIDSAFATYEAELARADARRDSTTKNLPLDAVQDDACDLFDPAQFAFIMRAFRQDSGLSDAELLEAGKRVNDLFAAAFETCLDRRLRSCVED
jgi:hypothetical protein